MALDLHRNGLKSQQRSLGDAKGSHNGVRFYASPTHTSNSALILRDTSSRLSPSSPDRLPRSRASRAHSSS